MQTYVARRLLLSIPTILGAVTLIFFIMRVLPGDPALAFVGMDSGEGAFDRRAYEAVREQMGLDKPLITQYGEWLGGFLRGDLGRSLQTREPVMESIIRRLPITLEIAFLATIIGAGLGVPLGVLAAYKQDSIFDYGLRALAAIGLAMPHFWIGVLILLLGVRYFLWSPPVGYNPVWEGLGANLAQLIWPAAVIGLGRVSALARMTRSSMLEVLHEDYVRTARAKGLRERSVAFSHALRNALIPIVTLLGLSWAMSVDGSVVMEMVFTVPGMGLLLLQGIVHRDYPVAQGGIALVVVSLVLTNLLVDLLYSRLDPRIRYQSG